MNLTLRQQRALESICETFLPPADGWPSALELGIPEAIAAAMDFNPRPKDRAQLLQLLDLWDSSLHGLFTIGHLKSFSHLSQEDRARVLLSWADSGIGKRRAAFQALRKAVGFLHVMLPAKNGHVGHEAIALDKKSWRGQSAHCCERGTGWAWLREASRKKGGRGTSIILSLGMMRIRPRDRQWGSDLSGSSV